MRPWTLIAHDTFKDIFELAEGQGYSRNTIAQVVHGARNARLLRAASDLLDIAKELSAWEQDPDHYGGDLADLGQRAQKLIAEVEIP